MSEVQAAREREAPFYGMANFCRKELHQWWSTRRWWKHLMIWVLLINGSLLLFPYIESLMMEDGTDGALGAGTYAGALDAYFNLSGILTALGAILILQDAVIGERESGTAAWVLSKPLSRTSFISAKAIGASIGLVGTAVLPTALLAALQIQWLAGQWPAQPWFAAGVGLIVLHLLFFVSLMVLLGTLFTQRLAATATALVVLFSGSVAPAVVPELARFMPWQLPQIGLAVTLEEGLLPFMVSPALGTAALTAAFAAAAVIIFRNVEL